MVGGVALFGTKTPAKAAGVDNAAATSTATVAQRSLSAQTNVSATLGYAGSYSVVNQAVGSFSQLPTVGEVIEPGEVLYAVGGEPVVLLTGSTPAYRTLVAGISGPDASELNNSLAALGYGAATLQGSTVFSAATAAALMKLQAHLGVAQTGVLTMDRVDLLAVGGPHHDRQRDVGSGRSSRRGDCDRDLDNSRSGGRLGCDPTSRRQGRRPGHDHAARHDYDARCGVDGRHGRDDACQVAVVRDRRLRRRSRSTSPRPIRRRPAHSTRLRCWSPSRPRV